MNLKSWGIRQGFRKGSVRGQLWCIGILNLEMQDVDFFKSL